MREAPPTTKHLFQFYYKRANITPPPRSSVLCGFSSSQQVKMNLGCLLSGPRAGTYWVLSFLLQDRSWGRTSTQPLQNLLGSLLLLVRCANKLSSHSLQGEGLWPVTVKVDLHCIWEPQTKKHYLIIFFNLKSYSPIHSRLRAFILLRNCFEKRSPAFSGRGQLE